MRILVFGKDGQLGKALQEVWSSDHQVNFLGRHDCDLSDSSVLEDTLKQYSPQIVINASAYTAVDKAETDRDLAYQINATAPQKMAEHIAKQENGLFIHYSTDYVFADQQVSPTSENHATASPHQLGVYGASKLLGEHLVSQAFQNIKSSAKYCIFRTSWVYGDGGNFIKTMLRLAKDRESLNIVADQVGVPTSAQFLAKVAKEFIVAHQTNPQMINSGIYHAVPNGSTSWHGLASYVISIAKITEADYILNINNIQPIPATDYPLPAPRPYNSRMHNAKLRSFLSSIKSPLALNDWQYEVRTYVQKITQR